MSEPVYVVMPVQGGGTQEAEKISSGLQEALQKKHGKTSGEDQVRDGQQTNGQEHNEQGQDGKPQNGPLKEIMDHQDSLYEYISWEDPFRTLGSYIVALGILLGAHYLPLTQWALKVGATTFGATYVTELASRQFGPNTFLSRLRPKEYKKLPEGMLNATLRDIHDFAQYAAVKVQRTIFAQDLGNTFVAFIGLTALYWLIKVMSPFGLAIMALTLLYISPLVTSSRGREVAHDARVRAGEVANAASEKGKTLAQDGKANAAKLSSKTQGAVMNTAESAKHTAANWSNRTSDAASDLSGAVTEKSRHLQQTSSTSTGPKGPINGLPSDAYDGHDYGNRSVADTSVDPQRYVQSGRAVTGRG